MTRTVLLTIGLALFSYSCDSVPGEGSTNDLSGTDTTKGDGVAP